MPQNTPCFVVQLSGEQQWSDVKNGLWDALKGAPHPKVRVYEDSRRVEFDCCYRDINNLISRSLAATLVGLAPGEGTNEQRVVARFGDPAYQVEFQASLDAARDTFRDFDYPDDSGDLGIDDKSPRAATDQILAGHDGMVLGNKHTDSHTKELLFESMDKGDFAKNNVGLMFIEEFSTEMQTELDNYANQPPGSEPSADLLRSVRQLDADYHLEGPASFEAMIRKAQEKQIKLYGINSNEATAHDDHPLLFGEQRNAQMNKVTQEAMKKAIKANPGKKFIALCGAAHSNTHEGGIPGIAQMFDAPAVRLGYDGKMVKDPEDPAKRAMPTRAEQHFIEAYVKRLTKVDETSKEGHDLVEVRQRALKLVRGMAAKGVLNLTTATDDDIAKAVRRDEVTRDVTAAVALKKQRIERRAEAKKDIDNGNAVGLKDKLAKYLADDPNFLKSEASTATTTLLHQAVEAGQAACLKELIARGADVNSTDSKGATALHKAGTAEMVFALVSGGADPRRPDNDGRTPLHAAAQTGTPAVMAELILRGADVNAPDKDGALPLHQAVKAGKGPAAKLLLDNGADPQRANRVGDTALHTAAAAGNKAVFDLVVERLDGDMGELDLKNLKGETALLLAVKNGKDDIVTKLILQGADVTAADKEQTTALHVAAKAGKTALVGALASEGADLDQRDGAGRTPLHLAAEAGQTAAAQELLNRGADINRPTNDNRNELHLAIANGDAALVQALITAGANVNLRSPDGTTPLLAALAKGRGDLVKELLAGGADATAVDDQGNTALHLALAGGAADAVPELLARGARVDARNRAGTSVSEQAAQTGGAACVLIQQAGANGWDPVNGPFDALFIEKFVEAARAEYKTRQPTPANPAAADDINAREAAALAASHIAALRLGGELINDAGAIDNLAVLEAKRRDAVALYVVTESRKANADKAKRLADDKVFKNLEENTRKLKELLDADPALVYTEPTLLHNACKWGSDTMVDLLVARGANVFYKDPAGKTPLHRAVEERKEKDFSSDEGREAREGRTESITNALLDSIPDMIAKRNLVDVQDATGQTPLHLAAYSDHPTAIKKLLTEGAHPDIRDKRGWSPLDVSIGSTKDQSEAMLLQYGGVSTPTLADEPPPVRSTIDALCAATFCENPEHAPKVRKQLEALYANEMLRPIMDLCALDAMRPRVSPKEESSNHKVGGVRFFIAADNQVGKLYNAVQQHSAPEGAYDEKVNVLHAGFKADERDLAGTLIHEMTHLATRIIGGKDTKPCDESNQTDYIKAIESDVRGSTTLVDGATEKDIQKILCGRMTGSSYAGIGDKSFLTEFIVGVPQIMAKYGPEAAQRYAPELYKYFDNFKDECEQFKTKTRFKDVRGKLDNTQLVADLKGKPLPSMTEKWLEKDARPDVDEIMKRVEAAYSAQHGVTLPTQNKNGEAHTIVYDPSVVRLAVGDPGYDEFTKKMAAVRKALVKTYSTEGIPALAADDVKTLVRDTVKLAGATPAGQLQDAMAKKTNQFMHKAKRHYLENKCDAKGQKLTSEELAELVVLKSEDATWQALKGMGGPEEPEVSVKKHGQLVQVLKKKIDGLPEDRRDLILARPGDFLEDRVDAVVNAEKQVFYKKTGKKGKPEHLSIKKDVWVKQLAKLKK